MSPDGPASAIPAPHEIESAIIQIDVTPKSIPHNYNESLDCILETNLFALGISAPVVARTHDGLVAGALALLDEPCADPPDERVEPEHDLDEHVRRGRQVVTAAPVRELVLEHRVEL